MKSRLFIYTIAISAITAVFLMGCTSYGQFRYHGKNAGAVTIEMLVERWSDYHIYYSGYDVDNATGILFDPKSDSKTLKPSSRWVTVDDQSIVEDLVAWLKIQDEPAYDPGLFTITGNTKQVYGYLYSAWDSRAVAKILDVNTLFVFDLDEPPHYRGPKGDDTRQPS